MLAEKAVQTKLRSWKVRPKKSRSLRRTQAINKAEVKVDLGSAAAATGAPSPLGATLITAAAEKTLTHAGSSHLYGQRISPSNIANLT